MWKTQAKQLDRHRSCLSLRRNHLHLTLDLTPESILKELPWTVGYKSAR